MEKLKMAEVKSEAKFMEKWQSAGFKAQKLKIEGQYAKSQARMRILEDFKNPEVVNAETNPYIYHNEDSKLQLPESIITFLLLKWVHHTSVKI